jgi:hypothetical protein
MGRFVGYKETRAMNRFVSSRIALGTACLILLVGVLPLAALAASEATGQSESGRPDGIDVLLSNREAVRFSVEGLTVQWRHMDLLDGAMTLYDPSVSGFSTMGDPAGPRTPRTGGWLLVPPGTRPELVTLKEDWQDAGGRPLMVQPVPVILPGEEPGLGSTSEILVLPGQDVPTDAPIPGHALRSMQRPRKARAGDAVSLGEPTWWRGHRIVSWNMVPVRHDEAGRALQTLTGGSWEVRFVADATADKSIPPGQQRKFTSRGDQHFAGIFLNSKLLSGLPTEAAVRGTLPPERPETSKRGGKSGTLLGDMEGRLAITKTGLFRVSSARLRQLQYIPDSPVAESEIRLYQRRYLERLDDGSGLAPYVEVEIPIHMVGEGDDFDGDDYFVFHGRRLRDDTEFEGDFGAGPEMIMGSGDPYEMNNEANFYWVAAAQPDAGQSWARMQTGILPAASGTPLEGYRRHEHHEEQQGFRELQTDVNDDRVYFNNDQATEVNVGFNPLWSLDPLGSDVEIRVGMTGQNRSTKTVSFSVVDDTDFSTLLGIYSISTMDEVVLNYSIPAAAIDGASARLVMTPAGARTERVFSYLNWVELSYDALYQAVGGKLLFHTGEEAGARPIEVTGFTSSDLGLVEVTDPRNPVWIELSAANVVADGSGWKLSLEAVNSTAEPRSFSVVQGVSSNGVPEFSYARSKLADRHVNPTELSGPVAEDPDLVVITHPEFRDALERWIDHRVNRAGGDLEVHVVLVQDLYDWYSGGLRDPWALKRFTNHAINVWGSWALTLVGDANENALELDVLSSARAWSKDWVPTHYHVQDTQQYTPELMASDKWYATMQAGQNYPEEDFPDYTNSPWEMYVGRLPCNSVTELNTMIDKIMIVENVQPGQAWRSRGIFFADDAWSNGYDATDPSLIYRSWEEAFANSERDSLAPTWRSGSPVDLPTVELYLADYLDPLWDGGYNTPRSPSLFKDYAETYATPPLLAALNSGGLVAHYQGHANIYVLASEYWIEDRLGFYRKDVASLNNASAPWVFFGMGCHISDWAQNPFYNASYPREQSLGEKFLVRNGGGASATYGSSGYEYIDANKVFGEYIFRRWLRHPPVDMVVGVGGSHRSRWMLGELMWASEADILAVNGHLPTYREMVAQYTLLGDPLMTLDAGEPVVNAVLVGGSDQEVSGEVDLLALDETNVRQLRITARDEAGIDRIEILDSAGNDLSDQLSTEVLPEGQTDHQEIRFDLDVPIEPYDHQLTVKVHDSGGPLGSDRHYELLLNMAQTGEFTVGGEAIDPATFVFYPDEPVVFSGAVTGSAWFSPDMVMELTSENLELSNISFNLDKSRDMTVQFTAVAPAGTSGDREVVLSIDTHETAYPLQSAGTSLPLADISNVINFPNPMRESTRFIFESAASSGDGVIRVFNVAGRHVARIPFDFSGNGHGIVTWDGRDNEGDRLGNGTYLYRIEMDTPAGHIASEMQRLVVMH